MRCSVDETVFSYIINLSKIRVDPLKSYCYVPSYIINMINLPLLHYNGHRTASSSEFHKHKQLYFSSTRFIPNSSNVDMRCQQSWWHIQDPHFFSHYNWHLRATSCTVTSSMLSTELRFSLWEQQVLLTAEPLVYYSLTSYYGDLNQWTVRENSWST